MKKALIILFILISYFADSQVLFDPTKGTVSNKSYSPAQAVPTDFRSQFRDTTLPSPYMRNYANRAEILSYLYLAKYRAGKFPIFMDSASRTYVLFFRDGTADANLVYWNTDASSSDSTIFATNYRVDTAKVNLRTSIAGKLDNTLATGKILAGNLSNVATAVTPGGDVTMTSGGSFSVLNQLKTASNGLTASGTNVKLGGTLTDGTTTLTSATNTESLLFTNVFNHDIRYINREKIFANGGQATALFAPTYMNFTGGDSVGIESPTALFSVKALLSKFYHPVIVLDTLTITTMGVSDSSDRAASTAWVKQQGYGGGSGSGITSLNALTATTQTFATGTSGTDFAISSASSTHTFNLPIASGTNTGKLSNTDWTAFNNKQPAGNYITDLTGDVAASGPGSAAATIQPNAVTYAKIQAAAGQGLLGATGAGNYQLITLGTNLSMSGSTLNASGSGGVTTYAALTDVSLTNPTGLSTPGNNQIAAYDTSLIKWTNRWFQEIGNPAYWRAADSFHVYGMSIAAGASASTPDSAYDKRLSVRTGSPFINHAQGGATVPNVVYQYWLYHPAIDNTKNCIIDIGVNELGASPSPAKIQSLIEGINVVAANQFLHTVVYANNMTKTGVWSNLTSGSDTIISKSTIQGGILPVKSTTSGSTLTTSVTGAIIVVGAYGCDINQTLGSYTISIDGNVIKTVDPVGKGINYFYNVLLPVNFRRPMVTVISGLGSGVHTVTITTTSSTEVDIDYVGSLNSNYNTKAILINHVLKSTNAGYTLDGGNSSDLTVDSANAKIDSLVGTYRNLGYYTLRSVPNENNFNIYNGLSGDGLHPNDLGHYQDYISIYNEILNGRANTYYTQGNGVYIDSFRHVSLSNNYAGTLNIRYATDDYTNTNGANSHLVLTNPMAFGQTSISFQTNQGQMAKIRADAAGNLTQSTYLNGDHIFNVGGDYSVGTPVMNITHTNLVNIPTGSLAVSTSTTNSSNKLTVNGNADVTGFLGVGISSAGSGELIRIYKNANALNLGLFENPNSGSSAAAGWQMQVGSESGYFYRTSSSYSSPARPSSLYLQEPTGAVVFFTTAEAMAIDHSRDVFIGNLASGGTPPTTTGTTHNVIADQNGKLSFDPTIYATQSALNDTAAAIRAAIGGGGSDTLNVENVGIGLNLAYTNVDTLKVSTILGANSIAGSKDSDSTLRLQLVNDTAIGTAASYFYGTNSVGRRGFYTLPLATGSVAGTVSTTTQTFAGAKTFSGNVSIPHIISTGSTPGIAAGTGAGTSPTISITGTDMAGTISLTAGTTPTAGDIIATITFNTAYGAAPIVVLQPANQALNSATVFPVVSVASNTTVFTFYTNNVTGLLGSTHYEWNYIVVQ